MGTQQHLMTIVLQSFRSHDVPEWIQRCMESARLWAKQRQFAYEFLDDDFLALPPEWLRKKAGRYITIVADLARLLGAWQRLSRGAERVIWIDADLLIFQPDFLGIDRNISYGYAKEIWCRRDSKGRVSTSRKMNNSACLFRNDASGQAHLHGYIRDCLRILEETTKIQDHTLIGTRYLTATNQESPLPVLHGFGLLCPMVMRAILDQDREVLEHFIERQGEPIYAANLCNFFRATSQNNSGIDDTAYSAVVDMLLRTSGRCLNVPPELTRAASTSLS